MDDEKIKILIGSNIAAFRKKAELTQLGLAEKLNYSDKAVSKWERGESIPDVLTLMQMANLFGVTVDELLCDPNRRPQGVSSFETAADHAAEKPMRRKANKNVVMMLTSVLVWFVALLFFVVISSIGIPYSWLAFCAAIPTNAIVLLCLRSAWHDFRWNRLLISIIVWGSLLCAYITVLALTKLNLWKILLLGIPGQFAVFLWFHLFLPGTGGKQHE